MPPKKRAPGLAAILADAAADKVVKVTFEDKPAELAPPAVVEAPPVAKPLTTAEVLDHMDAQIVAMRVAIRESRISVIRTALLELEQHMTALRARVGS